MVESTQLKCEICGEEMLAKIDPKNNRVFIFCPIMLRDHDIYVVRIANLEKGIDVL